MHGLEPPRDQAKRMGTDGAVGANPRSGAGGGAEVPELPRPRSIVEDSTE